MFDFLKRKKKEKKKEEVQIEEVSQPQNNRNNIYVGMYCPTCGFMTVDENSSALPLEGFAVCSNCGDLLKRGTFVKSEDDTFVLNVNAENILTKKTVKKSGGHYRVRQNGPVRTRHHDGVKRYHSVR